MCEITRENFYSELPVIEAALNESSFISIDMEFSKIDETIHNPFSYFDIPEERYRLLREKVSNITCIQLGLSIFTYDITNKTFKTCAYSIYTYPQTFYKSDSVVHFQTACVEFLNSHKFDFSKLFSSGVPYLTDEQEIKIKSEMLDDLFFDNYFKNTSRFCRVEDELDNILNIISIWYDNAEYGENTIFEINECNGPVSIILMQYHLLKKYKNIHIYEIKSGLSITKIKQIKNVDVLNSSYKNLKQKLFDEMMGIKYLLKLLFKLKKPLIGHNCGLDLLILCNQFFQPLPENFRDFQIFVSRNFGPIYDTKLLCKELKRILPKSDLNNWKGSSLSEIYLFLADGGSKINPNLINIKLSGIEESQKMKFHHAGWDAYYTGYCFIHIVHVIKKMSNKGETNFQTYTFTELLKSVESFKNKLYTSRSISNIIDLKTDNVHHQINYLIIQNKGMFYKALDIKRLTYRLKKICVFDIKLLSNYTALIVSPYLNEQIINDLKSEYIIDEYSHYQKRKINQYIVGLSLIISTPIIILLYLKK